VLLLRGRVDEAHDHAAWALRRNPSSTQALTLLAAVKARQSPLLGLWYRYEAAMARLGSAGSILVALAAFALVQGAREVLDQDHPSTAAILELAWLLVVGYTWMGPALFRRRLAQEIRDIRLRPEF
jgi:hypothetical protein